MKQSTIIFLADNNKIDRYNIIKSLSKDINKQQLS